MRWKAFFAVAGTATAILAGGSLTSVAGSSDDTAEVDYLVLYDDGVDAQAARAAVEALGAEVDDRERRGGLRLGHLERSGLRQRRGRRRDPRRCGPQPPHRLCAE